jgi:hypothetical protein
LLRATPQRLRRELRLAVPGLTLFWLDPLSDFATAIQLIAWLAASQSAVRRVVIAHRLSAHVEVTIRSAGAQLFLAVDDNVRALVKEWMPRWVDSRPHLVAGSIKPLAIARSEDNFLAPLQATLLPSEPP